METIKKPARAVNKKAEKQKANSEIKDAEVISEDITQETKPEDKKADESDKFVNSTAEVNLEVNKEEQNSAKVNFMDDSYMSSLLEKKAEESKEKVDGKEQPETEAKTKQEDVGVANVQSFSRDDMQDFAEVSVDIIDIGLSTALKAYSKDTAIAPYEIDINKKRRLVRQLVNIFMKHQVKFPLEFMFIISLVLCYTAPFMKARKTRREILNGTFKRESGKPGK